MSNDLIPAGRYLGSLKSASMTQSESGTEQMEISFQIEDQVRKVYLYFSEKAAPYSLPKLASIGFNGDFENPEFTKTTDIELVCKHEPYGGKNPKYVGMTMEKWDLAPRGKPAAPESLKRLGAQFRAVTGTPPPKPAGKPAAAPPRGGPPKKAEPVNEPLLKDDGNWTEERAWAEWNTEGRDSDKLNKGWLDAVDKQEKASKRDSAKFTSADWCAVAELGVIPF